VSFIEKEKVKNDVYLNKLEIYAFAHHSFRDESVFFRHIVHHHISVKFIRQLNAEFRNNESVKGDPLLGLSLSPDLTALDVFGCGYTMYVCTAPIERGIPATN
jgi:hypothetical protein